MTNLHFIYWLLREAILGLIITWCAIFSSLGQSARPVINGSSKPAVFVQAGVPVPNDESAPSFSPDGKTLYLSDSNRICISKMVNGKWAKPTVAPFSGHWKDWDSFISPDGKRLFFVSNRPLAGMPQDQPQKNKQLWYTDHLPGDAWSAPQHLDAPVNLDGINDYAPAVSSSGTLCFCSRGREGKKGMGAYYTKWLGDHYGTPKLLALNRDDDVYDPFIAADESYIIFSSDHNLYISYHKGSDWTTGEKLGEQVNNGKSNNSPYVSPDGKMLYYSQDDAPGILMVPVRIEPGVKNQESR